MQPYPVRLPESLIDDLDDEADERDLGTAEYIRKILRQRHTTQGNTQELTEEYTQRIEDHEQRLEDVEARLSTLEAEDDRHDDASDSADTQDDESPSVEPDALRQPSSASQHTPDAGGSPSIDESTDSLRAEAEEAAQAVDIPGRSAETRTARQDALLFAWEYLREHERAQSSEIANATFDAFEGEVGYSAQEKYRGRGLWQGYLREALRELPGVDGPGERGRTWEFVEDGAE